MANIPTTPLSEQVAIVTGGGSGIGRTLAETLLSAGVKVVIASRSNDIIHRTAGELNATYKKARAYPYVFDIRNESQARRLVTWTQETLGRVDILVNNSGTADSTSLQKLDMETWNRVLETNLRGALFLMQEVLPGMIERNSGDVINIISQAGKHGYANVPAYCASKHALLGLSRAVSAEMQEQRRNIRIFNILPSLVDVMNSADHAPPRQGTLHLRNLSKTLLFCLSLDREVRLGDIDLLATSLG